MISARTKAALQAANARGVKLGGNRGSIIDDGARTLAVASRRAVASARALDVAPTITELQAAGAQSLGALAKALTARGIPTARGSATWSPMQVSRVLKQMAGAA